MSAVIVRKCLGSARCAETLVEDFLIGEHRIAMFALTVQDLVTECLELEKESKNAWNYVLGMLFSDAHTNDIDELGCTMKIATSKLAYVYGCVEELVKRAEKQGHEINSSVDLTLARREIQKINEDAELKFPPVNERMVKESLEAFRRGEHESPEDLLRESQALSSQEH